jgi:hypothetical protein
MYRIETERAEKDEADLRAYGFQVLEESAFGTGRYIEMDDLKGGSQP